MALVAALKEFKSLITLNLGMHSKYMTIEGTVDYDMRTKEFADVLKELTGLTSLNLGR